MADTRGRSRRSKTRRRARKREPDLDRLHQLIEHAHVTAEAARATADRARHVLDAARSQALALRRTYEVQLETVRETREAIESVEQALARRDAVRNATGTTRERREH